MPNSTKHLCAPEKWWAWVLSLIVIFVVLLGAIAGKMTMQFDAPLNVPQEPLNVLKEESSFHTPAQTTTKDTNTATTNSTSFTVVSGHLDYFKTILEEHKNALPPAVIVQPVKQNPQTIQGHSDLFKAALDAHMKAQLAVTNQPTQQNP